MLHDALLTGVKRHPAMAVRGRGSGDVGRDYAWLLLPLDAVLLDPQQEW